MPAIQRSLHVQERREEKVQLYKLEVNMLAKWSYTLSSTVQAVRVMISLPAACAALFDFTSALA